MKKNPWMGPSPYPDPQNNNENIYFCGREKAINELFSLINNNLFVTLYGRSGIGKTSLLQAGLFPVLREYQYLPLSIRLGQLPKNENLAEYILKELEFIIGKDNIESNYISSDYTEDECLWSYFASTKFYDKNGNILYPVIVLDQFEEVLVSRKKDAFILMRQIYALLDDSFIIDEENGQHTETNFRIIVSIREDDLFRMDDCIDSLNLSEMLYNRFRLTQMTEEEARSVILIPGKSIIEESEKEELSNRIINIAKGEDGEQINTLILSLICYLLYNKVADSNEKIKINNLQELGDNPLKEFYISASKRLKLKRKQRIFIEEKLIEKNGRRNSVSIHEFESCFGTEKIYFNGANKLFNKVTVFSDNSIIRVELMHDLLAQAIHDEKKERLQKKTFILRLIKYGIFDSLTLAFDLFLILFLFLTQGYVPSIYISTIGLSLVFSTYMMNVMRINGDYRFIAFIPPVFALSSWIYFSLFIGFRIKGGLYAYHIIKPSLINNCIDIFYVLNVILIILTIYSSITQFYNKNRKNTETLKLKEFFLFNKKENRFSQIAILIGLFVSLIVILFTPKTYNEKIRELAESGNPESMIELGNYYMEYDRNTYKAREWYNKAKLAGIDVDSLIYNTYRSKESIALTDMMKKEAIEVLITQSVFYAESDIYQIVVNNYISIGTANIILEYFEKTNNVNAAKRWLMYIAQNHKSYIANLGFQFWRGELVEQDLVRAFELYKASNSYNNVVKCYMNGWGVEKSALKAQKYIEENNCINRIDPLILVSLDIACAWESFINTIF